MMRTMLWALALATSVLGSVMPAAAQGWSFYNQQ